MKQFFIVALAMTLSIPSLADNSFVPIGKRATATLAFFGCKQSDDLKRVKQFVMDKDNEAAVRHALSKDCSMLAVGTKGKVEDISVWSNSTCIRPQGEPDCVWIPTPFVAEAN